MDKLFITGIPRSGTGAILNAILAGSNAVHVTKDLFDGEETTSQETNCFFSFSPDKIKEVYRKLEDQGHEIAVEKTPGHILATEEIKTIFPDSLIIYVQRNPIYVLNSMVNSHIKGLKKNFKNSLNIASAWYQEFFEKNHLIDYIFCYEDLIYEYEGKLLFPNRIEFSRDTKDFIIPELAEVPKKAKLTLSAKEMKEIRNRLGIIFEAFNY